MHRPVKQIDTHPQGCLFGPGDLAAVAEAVALLVGPVVFNQPYLREIFLGAVRLDEHLRAMGATEALRVRELLDEQSWQVFERQYKPGGRRPYAPRGDARAGALRHRQRGEFVPPSSAAAGPADLGCMWITGGLCPDHASIGRFIQQHDGHMSGEFLPGLTPSVLRVTASGLETVAGDGTVVQAGSLALSHPQARGGACGGRRGPPGGPGQPRRCQAPGVMPRRPSRSRRRLRHAPRPVRPRASRVPRCPSARWSPRR